LQGRAPSTAALRLSAAESNFRQKVRIETSDDNRFWLVSRDDGYIFDFTQGDRKLSVLTVDYPVSRGAMCASLSSAGPTLMP